MKDSIQQIIQDTKNLLSFHESLGIANYPLSSGVKKLLRSGQSQSRRVVSTPVKGRKTTPKAAPTSITPQQAVSLREIKTELGDCTRCSLYKNRSSIIFGTGAEKAKLVIIGEWPSISDDQAGELFSGEEGEMLDKMLANVLRLGREDVYISSIIKCRVTEEKTADRQQISTCLPFISSQIDAVRPAIICTMGPVAAQTLLKTNKPLIRLRGHFHEYKGIPLMPTLHPSFLLKNPEMKKAALIDLQMIASRLSKT